MIGYFAACAELSLQKDLPMTPPSDHSLSRRRFCFLAGTLAFAPAFLSKGFAASLLENKASTLPYQLKLQQMLEPKLTPTRAVGFDSKKRLIAGGGSMVKIFDAQNALLQEIPVPGTVSTLTIGPDDSIYVGLENRVLCLDTAGKKKTEWGTSGKEPGQFVFITSLAIMGSFIFAADSGNRRVSRFTVDGDFVDDISGFQVPSAYFDCAVDTQGVLYVAHTGNHRIEQYDANRKRVSSWGEFGTAPEKFCGCCNPIHFSILPDGKFVTTEKGIVRLKVYDASGKLLAHLGSEAFKDCSPENASAYLEGPCQGAGMDVAADRDGRIALATQDGKTIRFYTLEPNKG
ncbi:TPA: hypothetical protein DDW35_12955 [Candidatus Sumerlaeota bacterium]|nr:hypothetical protein [Candidatus Sumerlaeota bacterium]